MKLKCKSVYSGWGNVATPDDIDIVIEFERTTHEFYPSLREMILVYDAVVQGRTIEFPIGTGDYVSISRTDPRGNIVELYLPPITINVERSELVSELESLLEAIFSRKDASSSARARKKGLDLIQSWIEEQGGETNVHTLYSELINN